MCRDIKVLYQYYLSRYNNITPNRIFFQGCVINTSENWYTIDPSGTYRTAGIYVSGGQQVLLDTCDLERPYPAIWAAREIGTSDSTYSSSSSGIEVRNCTFLMLSGDKGLPYAPIRYDGYRQFKISSSYFLGQGGPTIDAIAYIDYANNSQAGQFIFDETNRIATVAFQAATGYTGNTLKYTTTCYATEKLITGLTGRYSIPMLGPRIRIGLTTAGRIIHAIYTSYNSTDYSIPDNTIITLSALTSINGGVTIANNADNGSGTLLSGRILTQTGSNIVLTADTQFIVLQWSDEQSVWYQIGSNIIPEITATATDANYIATTASFIILPLITASRTLTLSTGYPTGKKLTIWNKNTSINNWSFVANAKDATGATLTNLTNTSFYNMIFDGTNWIKTT